MALKDVRERCTRKVPVSLEKVARDTGIPKSRLYYWEHHPSAIKAEGAEILAKYFGCKPADLF